MPLLVDYEPAIDAMRTAINTAPSAEEFGNALGLAFGRDYVTTTSTTAVNVEISPLRTETFVLDNGIWTKTPVSTFITKERTIDDIVNEKIEQYKELMRLQALGCKNCGGSINKETMICDYCGTRYRN
jgi:hypothetical protein